MGRFKDLIGMKFGKLTVVGKAENYISPKGRKTSRWKCICDCGNPEEIIVNRNFKKSYKISGIYDKKLLLDFNPVMKKQRLQ
jgi:hypothetical protein